MYVQVSTYSSVGTTVLQSNHTPKAITNDQNLLQNYQEFCRNKKVYDKTANRIPTNYGKF